MRHKFEVYFFSALLAFCSLYYEYVFAHILSVSIGGTKFQYLIIISLFTSALGLGTLSHSTLKNKIGDRLFLYVEILLSLIGSLGPFILTYILATNSYVPHVLAEILSYTSVFVIGFLSGMEIPSLFERLKNNYGKVLAFDYLGMLGVSFLFPFVILPYAGAGGGTVLVAGMNLIAVTWLIETTTKRKTFLFLINIIYLGIVLVSEEFLNSFLSSIYLAQR